MLLILFVMETKCYLCPHVAIINLRKKYKIHIKFIVTYKILCSCWYISSWRYWMVVPVVMLILLIVFWLILVYLKLSTTSQIVYITNDRILGPVEQSKHFQVFQNLCLTLQCIILKNNQRHFQNLVMFPPQDF